LPPAINCKNETERAERENADEGYQRCAEKCEANKANDVEARRGELHVAQFFVSVLRGSEEEPIGKV